MAKNSSRYYVDKAKKAGMDVEYGSKHIKVSGVDPQTGNRTTMMIPHDLKGNGTEHTIVKWFVRMGILFFLLYLVVDGLWKALGPEAVTAMLMPGYLP